MELNSVFLSLGLIAVLLIAGKLIRGGLKSLQALYIPSSIIAGVLGLCFGPQVLGSLAGMAWGPDSGLAAGLWPEEILKVWQGLPGLLISVVFAGLFLGKSLPGLKTIWKNAGPMVTHGQILAWGQYVVGLSIVLFLLYQGFDFSPLAGALIEIGFEGGHGTAAGLADTFSELGFADGADLALGLATLGVVLGVLLGTVFVNWGIRRGYIDPKVADAKDSREILKNNETLDDQPVENFYNDRSVEPFSIHIGLIALAIGLGWIFLRGAIWLESFLVFWFGWPELMRHVPLFPLAMIGGVVVQIFAKRFNLATKIDRKLVNRISGTALDLLIVAALATMSLSAIGENTLLFFLLALGGILWNIFGLLVLARFLFADKWLTYGLANFGQGTGMTVIGLVLVKMSDPLTKTRALEAFGYKQLLFEPVVGGGIFTAASLPLIAEFGPVPVLIGVSVVMVAWIIYGWFAFYRSSNLSKT